MHPTKESIDYISGVPKDLLENISLYFNVSQTGFVSLHLTSIGQNCNTMDIAKPAISGSNGTYLTCNIIHRKIYYNVLK